MGAASRPSGWLPDRSKSSPERPTPGARKIALSRSHLGRNACVAISSCVLFLLAHHDAGKKKTERADDARMRGGDRGQKLHVAITSAAAVGFFFHSCCLSYFFNRPYKAAPPKWGFISFSFPFCLLHGGIAGTGLGQFPSQATPLAHQSPLTHSPHDSGRCFLHAIWYILFVFS